VDHVGGSDLWDAVIVGGGPAGLSAALLLGRARRRVLLCDSGAYRNAASHAMHGFLSRDGMDPAEFHVTAREQLAAYPTVGIARAEVLDASLSNQGFSITARGEGLPAAPLATRKLLLATGLVDELPELPGLREIYGTAAWHCPYCDGFENSGRKLAILGGGMAAVRLALELHGWSEDLTLCTNGAPLSTRERRHIAPFGIVLREESLAGLELGDCGLRGLRFASGEILPAQGLFLSMPTHQRSDLAQRLGCRITEGGCVRADKYGVTDVPGLFVAGDASPGLQMAIVAAAQGTMAAFALNSALLKDEAASVRRLHSRDRQDKAC
jgi:thioredoxin reductase